MQRFFNVLTSRPTYDSNKLPNVTLKSKIDYLTPKSIFFFLRDHKKVITEKIKFTSKQTFLCIGHRINYFFAKNFSVSESSLLFLILIQNYSFIHKKMNVFSKWSRQGLLSWKPWWHEMACDIIVRRIFIHSIYSLRIA